jgi:hypothetical protein
MQMDRELGLILGKSDAKGTFITEWNTHYVAAILGYGEKLRKSGINEIISSMTSSGKSFLLYIAYNILLISDEILLQMRISDS